jgi:50S ribosomal subunit-associated GTPase HflX
MATKQQHAAAVLQQQREFDAKQDELQALADAANQRAAQVYYKLTTMHSN